MKNSSAETDLAILASDASTQSGREQALQLLDHALTMLRSMGVNAVVVLESTTSRESRLVHNLADHLEAQIVVLRVAVRNDYEECQQDDDLPTSVTGPEAFAGWTIENRADTGYALYAPSGLRVAPVHWDSGGRTWLSWADPVEGDRNPYAVHLEILRDLLLAMPKPANVPSLDPPAAWLDPTYLRK